MHRALWLMFLSKHGFKMLQSGITSCLEKALIPNVTAGLLIPVHWELTWTFCPEETWLRLEKRLFLQLFKNWAIKPTGSGFVYYLLNCVSVLAATQLMWTCCNFKDGGYYCYCAYVVRISRYSDFLSAVLINTGIFLRGSKLCGESRT